MRERLITIDINEVNFKILKYKQFDNNNILKVEITEKKKLINLSGYSAYFFFKLPSGEILQKNTTIEDNKIKVFLDSGVFSESGRVKVEITLSNVEQIVTTFTMYFEIEETIDRNDAIQSKPEWDIISDILNGSGGSGGSIDLSGKVDKEEGKGLISLSEIERLANVDNYDDTEIRELIEEKADEEDLHEHENKDILDEITEEKIEQWNKGGFSGDYNDLTNKPTIPSIEGLATETYVQNKISEAQLNGGEVDLSNYATKDELHEHINKDVLDNITSEKVNDWDNKSEFDGDYNSLTNKPSIPSLAGYATETYVKNEIANAQLNSDDNEVDLSGFATKDELNAKADVEDIPTKTSQLVNDSNYLSSVPSEYITETELNNKGYLTEHQDISGKVDKEDGKGLISTSEIERLANVDNYTHPPTHNATMITEDENHRFVTDEEKVFWNNKEEKNHTHRELHEHTNKDILDDITSDKIDEWDNKSEFDGDYNSLTNKPTIPTRVSQLTNDGIYATETYVQNKIAEAQLSGEEVDLSGFATKDELNAKANIDDIPTKTSQLVNDNNYLSSVPSEYITETELNNKGYLTEHQDISGKVDKETGKSLIEDSEIERLKNVEDNANNYVHPNNHNATMIIEDENHRFVTDDEKAFWDSKSEFDGNYNSLSNKPTIPSIEGLATETYVQNKIAEAQLSGEEVDLSGYATKDELSAKADVEDIPTKVSQLENDKGYLTEHINIDGKVDKEEGKSLIADSEIERLANVDNYTHPLTHNAMIIVEDINHRFVSDTEKEFWDSKSEFDGDYDSLTNKPTIPTKVSELENDNRYLSSIPDEYVTETELNNKGYLTEHQDISGKVDKETGKSLIEDSEIERLKNIEDNANNYTHPLTHNAMIIVEDTNHRFVSDTEKEFWDSKSEFDGDYNSLSNKPTIPTRVSQLENDNNYLTSIPSEYITETELNNKGYLTEHQDISGKVDKVEGKSLIEDSEIERLKNIEDNANNYVHPLTHNAMIIVEDTNHRFVSDTEKEFWDSKSEFDGDYNSLINKPSIPSIEGLATETYVQNEINNKLNVDLISNSISGTVLTLTNDRYQVAEIVNGTTIALPTLNSYTEIHLFFTTISDITIIMPNGIKYQKIPTITTDKTYEFIFTYINTTIGWVFGYIEYTN